jgi:hypothetical protein
MVLNFFKLGTADRHQVVYRVGQAVRTGRNYPITPISERLHGTRSCSITFRKERLHEISLKSTEQFGRVTDRQAGRGLLVASRGQFERTDVYQLRPAVGLR